MEENIFFNQALKRIRKIKKRDNYNDHKLKGSHILLFLEHIIIMGKCAVKFNLLKSTGLLFKNLCEEINEDWTYENSMDENLIYEIGRLHRWGSHLLGYLNWELHRSELEAIGVGYYINPYEPILKFIERDGTYGFEQGILWLGLSYYEVILNYWGINQPRKVNKMESYTDLSDESLNIADIEYLENPKIFLKNTKEKFLKDLKRL